MALDMLFGDSFDYYDSSGLASYWSTPGTDTDIDNGAGVPRTGLGCLRINSAAFGPTRVIGLQDKLLMFGAFNPNTVLPLSGKANLMWMTDSSIGVGQVRLCYEADGAVSVYNGNDPFPLLLGRSVAGVLDVNGYNFLVCKAEIAALGTVQVRVNGVLVLDLIGVRTQFPTSAAGADVWQLLCIGGNFVTFWDDVGICTWTDAADDITTAPQAYSFVPVSDGSVAWTPASGVTNFPMVDNVPPNPAEFVSSNVPGAIDQYIHDFPAGENVPPIPGTFSVLFCLHTMLADLDAPGIHSLASDANGDIGAARALTTSQNYITTARTPGPVASLAQLAVTPFGPDLVT